MPTLKQLGWSSFFEQQITAAEVGSLIPVRVVEEQRDRFRVLGTEGERPAEIAGRLRREDITAGARPCVGDWVLVRPVGDGPAPILRVLDRRSRFVRRAAGRRSAEQVVAANADTVFIVQSLNSNLNVRRLERYLALLWESGARPVILLSKADLCADVEAIRQEIRQATPGVPVHLTSAVSPDGVEALVPYLGEGETVAFVGSSGVGKSSLINRLMGRPVMAVREIRLDDRGRHATTFRRLFLLPTGGLLMDTPGMRTVLLTGSEEGIEGVFADIAELAAECRFADCTHEREPGCAVLAAVEEERIDPERLRSFRKLRREEHYEARRHDHALQAAETRRWRLLYKAYRARPDKRRV